MPTLFSWDWHRRGGCSAGEEVYRLLDLLAILKLVVTEGASDHLPSLLLI